MGKGSGSTNGVTFTLNGEEYRVDVATPKVTVETKLVDFIRDHANLKGTKVMCREGGCGACVVTVRTKDPVTGADVVKPVNSCMTPIYSCQGWDISTVESLGNGQNGYHAIQKRLINFHGTQCGFCTPGMVMNMNSLLEAKKKGLKVEDVEKSFDGNICRCTGYRPILDAFKSMASDAPEDLKKRCADIEDCASCPCPMRQGKGKENAVIQFSNGAEWTIATDLETAFAAIQRSAANGKTMRFVAGNTGSGVFKNGIHYEAYVDITGIPELKVKRASESEVVLGAGVTLADTIVYLNSISNNPGFEYASEIAKHLERVANVPVRNNGTVGGNLMMKHDHHDFPSDVFVLLEAIGAILGIASGSRQVVSISPSEFLHASMTGKLIVSIHLPKRGGNYLFRSFKITRRYQNAHAYVNAGILIRVASGKVLEQPRIVYGGIHPNFVHASVTEKFLAQNPDLANPAVLQKALSVLASELSPNVSPSEAVPKYRVGLAQSLLYKTVLGILNNKLSSPKKATGAMEIPRGISKGKQEYEQEGAAGPLYKGIPKLEANWQAAGEAEYTGDIPQRPDELFGVFVQSTVGSGMLDKIDAAEALAMPGVVKLITAKDIKGSNDTLAYSFFPKVIIEPVYAQDKIYYHGQSVAMILAKTREIAVEAAKKVKVTYKDVAKPVVDVEEAYENALQSGTIQQNRVGTFTTSPDPTVKVKHTVKGEMKTASQYHFHIENQNCVVIPREDGIDVHVPSQWMDHCQSTISLVLGMPCSSINLQVRRVGGGFGAKITRASQIAAATAVAATTVGKPVRVYLDVETNMSMMGKRPQYIMKYEAGFDDTGRLGKLNIEMYGDSGYSGNEPDILFALFHMQSVYRSYGWEVTPGALMTNTPPTTFLRAPGSPQGIAILEDAMEQVAHYLKLDPVQVRSVNLLKTGDGLLPNPFSGEDLTFAEENLIPQMIDEVKVSGEYEKRRQAVETFNANNRWKKRGLSLVPTRYPTGYKFGANFPTMISIYHFDGTVACSHGGIEIGQGLNTKVQQVIAQQFQIPLDKIKLKPSNTFVAANGFCTGASVSSELCCYGALKACEVIKERLKPILEKLENPTWEKLIAEANAAKVELSALYIPGPKDELKGYSVWAIVLTEVEIDVLTGENKVVRTDILEDAGKSLSPAVDVGQIEGGYLLGQGMWTVEKIVYDKETGALVSNRTWDYKVPETRDVPEDLRITLLKNAPNPNGILRSKATGEPIVDGTVAVYLALKRAIIAARNEKGVDGWFRLDAPVTPEDVYLHCLTSAEDLTP